MDVEARLQALSASAFVVRDGSKLRREKERQAILWAPEMPPATPDVVGPPDAAFDLLLRALSAAELPEERALLGRRLRPVRPPSKLTLDLLVEVGLRFGPDSVARGLHWLKLLTFSALEGGSPSRWDCTAGCLVVEALSAMVLLVVMPSSTAPVTWAERLMRPQSTSADRSRAGSLAGTLTIAESSDLSAVLATVVDMASETVACAGAVAGSQRWLPQCAALLLLAFAVRYDAVTAAVDAVPAEEAIARCRGRLEALVADAMHAAAVRAGGAALEEGAHAVETVMLAVDDAQGMGPSEEMAAALGGGDICTAALLAERSLPLPSPLDLPELAQQRSTQWLIEASAQALQGLNPSDAADCSKAARVVADVVAAADRIDGWHPRASPCAAVARRAAAQVEEHLDHWAAVGVEGLIACGSGGDVEDLAGAVQSFLRAVGPVLRVAGPALGRVAAQGIAQAVVTIHAGLRDGTTDDVSAPSVGHPGLNPHAAQAALVQRHRPAAATAPSPTPGSAATVVAYVSRCRRLLVILDEAGAVVGEDLVDTAARAVHGGLKRALRHVAGVMGRDARPRVQRAMRDVRSTSAEALNELGMVVERGVAEARAHGLDEADVAFIIAALWRESVAPAVVAEICRPLGTLGTPSLLADTAATERLSNMVHAISGAVCAATRAGGGGDVSPSRLEVRDAVLSDVMVLLEGPTESLAHEFAEGRACDDEARATRALQLLALRMDDPTAAALVNGACARKPTAILTEDD